MIIFPNIPERNQDFFNALSFGVFSLVNCLLTYTALYLKWFGDIFCDLEVAPKILPIFLAALNSTNWNERESHLSKAYVLMAEKHNALQITPHIKPEVSHFHNRPFLVSHAARFTDALLAQIKDPQVSMLPTHLGSVDQISDNTDVLDELSRCQSLRVLYKEQND